jgi:hypothetical protein
MFDDIDARPGRHIGSITFDFLQTSDGQWYSEVMPPKLKTSEIRAIYKMALIVAVLQDTCKNKLGAIDQMILNNKEIAEYHNMMVEEKKNKPPGSVDIDKYQQPLPFGEKSNDTPRGD